MCDWGAVSLGGLSFASNLMNSKDQAQSQYANEMRSYVNAQANWEINKKQADDAARMRRANAVLQMQQLQIQQQEVNDAATEQKSGIALEMEQARAMARLSAGEAGISGNSVDRILAGLGSTEQSKLAAVESSRVNAITDAQLQKLNVRQSAESVPIYSAIGDAPQYTGNSLSNYLAAAVGGVTTGVSAWYNPRKQDSKTKSETSSSSAVSNPYFVNRNY